MPLGQVLVPYDVKLNSQKYLLIPGTYRQSAMPESMARPGVTHGGDPTAKSNDDPAWAYWSQTLFQGDGVDDWKGDGGFYRAYGIDLFNDGQCTAATQFTAEQARAGATAGWLFIPLNTTTMIGIDKVDGRAFTTTTGTIWTDRGYINTGAQGTNAWAFYKGTLVVSQANGNLRTSTDGITWSAYSVGSAPSTSCYVLGSYKSRLYIAWAGDLRYWDGTTLTTVTTVDGMPIDAAAGNGVLFILASGTPAHLYMAQGDSLVELLQWPSDFDARSCIYMDTLYVSGGTLDVGGGYSGEIWRLNQNGLEFLYEVPQISGTGVDYRIYSLYNLSGLLYFSYNSSGTNPCGVGVYDSTLDIWTQPALGNYIGSVAAASNPGVVNGISSWKGMPIIGVQGVGIYYANPGTTNNFQITSSLFGSDSKRVNKMWGWAEVTHSALTTGQSWLVEYSVDGGTTWTTLGTKAYAVSYIAPDSANKTFLYFPANYKSSVMQYRVTATTNGAAMALLDMSLSFIEASASAKRIWKFAIGLQGDTDFPMKYRDKSDFERTAIQMKAELDALWNVRFVFEDITGTTYNVVMPRIGIAADDIVRTASSGVASASDLKFIQIRYEVSLVEV